MSFQSKDAIISSEVIASKKNVNFPTVPIRLHHTVAEKMLSFALSGNKYIDHHNITEIS